MRLPKLTANLEQNEQIELCSDDPWKRLGYAVVLQAMQDYHWILLRLQKQTDPKKRKRLLCEKQKLEDFFLSPNFYLYCSADPHTLLRMLKGQPLPPPGTGPSEAPEPDRVIWWYADELNALLRQKQGRGRPEQAPAPRERVYRPGHPCRPPRGPGRGGKTPAPSAVPQPEPDPEPPRLRVLSA